MEPTSIPSAASYAIVGVISFVAGGLAGYFYRGFIENKKDENSGNMIVLVTVAAVWSISMIVDILSPTYETSPLVHGLMGAIVGFFYRPGQTKEKEVPK